MTFLSRLTNLFRKPPPAAVRAVALNLDPAKMTPIERQLFLGTDEPNALLPLPNESESDKVLSREEIREFAKNSEALKFTQDEINYLLGFDESKAPPKPPKWDSPNLNPPLKEILDYTKPTKESLIRFKHLYKESQIKSIARYLLNKCETKQEKRALRKELRGHGFTKF